MFVQGFQEYDRWVRVENQHDSRLPSARTVDKEEFVMRRKCYSQRGKRCKRGRHVRGGLYKEKKKTRYVYSLKSVQYTDEFRPFCFVWFCSAESARHEDAYASFSIQNVSF